MGHRKGSPKGGFIFSFVIIIIIIVFVIFLLFFFLCGQNFTLGLILLWPKGIDFHYGCPNVVQGSSYVKTPRICMSHKFPKIYVPMKITHQNSLCIFNLHKPNNCHYRCNKIVPKGVRLGQVSLHLLWYTFLYVYFDDRVISVAKYR